VFKLPCKVATPKIRREIYPTRDAFVAFSIDLLVSHAASEAKKRKAREMIDFFNSDSDSDASDP